MARTIGLIEKEVKQPKEEEKKVELPKEEKKK